MTLYLIRHGQTASNRDGIGLGRDDLPLTPLGEQQAKALAKRLEPIALERILCSPLGRAHQTALALAAGREVAVEMRAELIELDLGETEGLTFPEMRERFPGFLRDWAGSESHLVRMPGGERLVDLAGRLQPLVRELASQPEAKVAVVAHNFVLKALITILLGLDVSCWRIFTIDVTSLSIVDFPRGRAALVLLNDTCHTASLVS